MAIKKLWIGLIFALLCLSPQLRSITSKVLRMTADFFEPEYVSPFHQHRNPKHIKIPNPFYVEKNNDY